MALDSVDLKFWSIIHPSATGTNSDKATSCDICGDSKYKKKKRLHLYTKGMDKVDSGFVHCFNCGYSSNMFGYLKEYYPEYFTSYKNEKREGILGSLEELSLSPKVTDEPDYDFMPENNLLTLKEESLRCTPKTISPIDFNTSFPEEVLQYLDSRGITPEEHWLYSTKETLRWNNIDMKIKDYIIVPFIYNGEWYGLQALNWQEKRFYVLIVEGNHSWKVENWFNVDINKPVYIFESIYDRLSSGLSNSIAQMGATISEERLQELKEPIFCYDNQLVDEAARRESLQALQNNHKVFVWPSGSEAFKDTNDLRKKGVKEERIQKMIEQNIYEGIEGVVKIEMMPKV